jgi:uncharacterized protein (DUF1697 family)
LSPPVGKRSPASRVGPTFVASGRQTQTYERVGSTFVASGRQTQTYERVGPTFVASGRHTQATGAHPSRPTRTRQNAAMTRYVALLRGVNLGSHNKVAMPKLRDLADRLGYDEVSTYINSGNLLFSTSGSSAGARDRVIAETLADGIETDFGIRIDVAVRTLDQLRQAVDANPYPDGDPKQTTIAFLMGAASADATHKVAALATDVERVTFGDREIYVDYGGGLAKSKLAVTFSKVIGVSATVRNIRTCQTLVGLLDG